jgi:hypothetical protein
MLLQIPSLQYFDALFSVSFQGTQHLEVVLLQGLFQQRLQRLLGGWLQQTGTLHQQLLPEVTSTALADLQRNPLGVLLVVEPQHWLV